jgi:hypothetical protein
MNEETHIPGLVRAVVEKVSTTFSSRPTNPFTVYFDYGRHSEVMKNLQYKEQDPGKPKKFPIIWLITPFKEKRSLLDGSSKANFHFVIAHDTDMNYSEDERTTNVYLPILYPVYNELLKQFMYATRAFEIDRQQDYDYIDISYAKLEPDGTNILGHFVDVIDIQNFTVRVKNIC